MKAKDFDKKFDQGQEDIIQNLDLSQMRRPNHGVKQIKMEDILQKAEREKQIEEGNYTIEDFNEETQQAIKNIEENKNLTVCKNKEDLYKQLGI